MPLRGDSYLVSFGGMGKSIRSDGAPIRRTDAPRRSDEFPAGYSLAACSPACRLRFTSRTDHASLQARLWGLWLREGK
jgi:hypothetical protein